MLRADAKLMQKGPFIEQPGIFEVMKKFIRGHG